jgi:hypothetical protein
MNIIKIDTEDKESVRSFIRFPFEMYAGSAYWVPPFPGEMQLVMNQQAHPFYHHSTADFFAAELAGRIVGRLAVLKNNNYCKFHDQQVAFVYYLEMEEDARICEALLAAAEDWARQHGADAMLIGKGFLRSNGQGIHVGGFDVPPAMGIAYQMPYYDDFIKQCGYEKETDYFSGILEHRIDPLIHQTADKVRSRYNFWIKSFSSTKEMETWIPWVDKVHHEAFAGNPSFYPSTEEEFALICRNILAIANPAYVKLVMHEEEVAGFILSYPNINRALRATRGSSTVFAMLRLLYEKKTSRSIDMNGIGLLPKYQGLGGNALLYSEVEKVIVNNGMKHAEIIQVDERNMRSKSDMNTVGVDWKKTHRTYIKKI